MSVSPPQDGSATARRQARLSQLAQAPHDRLIALWEGAGFAPDYRLLRAPEIGMVMVRGRAGGTGAPFNLGEMTVTRASVALTEGQAVGHGYIQGRSHQGALIAALADALCEAGQAAEIDAKIIAPLDAEKREADAARAARAQATKVQFVTMVRGE